MCRCFSAEYSWVIGDKSASLRIKELGPELKKSLWTFFQPGWFAVAMQLLAPYDLE
jgi:hypothetical protein